MPLLDMELIDRAFARRDDKSRGLLVLVLPLLAVYGLYRLARAAARRGSQRGSVTAISYVLFTAGYVASISILVSSGDFPRYRFEVDPLHVLLFALLLSDLPQFVSALASRAAHTLTAAGATLRRRVPAQVDSRIKAPQ